MSTLVADQLETGYRSVANATVHDIDDQKHQVCVEFPITIDSYRSDFGPSCFQDGWDHQLPAMVVNHNQDVVVGRAIKAQSLPDRHRLVGRFASFTDVPQARAAFANIRDGIYPGWSFAYVQGATVPHPSGLRSARRYTKARMVEYGPVLAPSIPGTRVTDLRSATALMNRPSALRQKLLDDLGFSEEEAQHFGLSTPDLFGVRLNEVNYKMWQMEQAGLFHSSPSVRSQIQEHFDHVDAVRARLEERNRMTIAQVYPEDSEIHKAVKTLVARHYPNVAKHVRVGAPMGAGALAEVQAHMASLPASDPQRLAVDRRLEKTFAHIDAVSGRK